MRAYVHELVDADMNVQICQIHVYCRTNAIY
jgi:hypothetical protein